MDRDEEEVDDPQESDEQVQDALDEEAPEPDVADLQSQLTDLKRDYEASSREGKRLAELQRQSAERERSLLQALQSPRPISQPEPDRFRPDLSALGIPEEAAPVLDRLIAERAAEIGQRAAAQQVQAMMEPFLRAAEAQTHIDLELGDYPRQEISRFMAQNPSVKERYDKLLLADPVGAAEWALLRYQKEQGTQAEAGMHADNAEAQRMKEKARTQGRVTTAKSTRALQGRESRQTQVAERLQKLFQDAQTGDRNAIEAYKRERLRSLPSMEKLDWGEEE